MKKKPVPQYTGPRLSAVQKMDDAMVQLEFRRLKHEPAPSPVLFYDTYGDIDDVDARKAPTHWIPEQLNEAHTKHQAFCASLLRGELFNAYIETWVTSLTPKDQWAIIESSTHEGEEVSFKDSEKRATSKAEIIRKATHAILMQLQPENHDDKQTRTTATPKRTKKESIQTNLEHVGE